MTGKKIRLLLLERRDITLGLGAAVPQDGKKDGIVNDLDSVLEECRREYIPRVYHPVFKPELFDLTVVNSFDRALKCFRERIFDFSLIYKKHEGDTLITALLKEIYNVTKAKIEKPVHIVSFPPNLSTFEKLTRITKVSEASSSSEGVAWTIWRHALSTEKSGVMVSFEQEGRSLATLMEGMHPRRNDFLQAKGIIYFPPNFYDTSEFFQAKKQGSVGSKISGILNKKIM